MKITKYLHSCLLLEHNGIHLLIDPGLYTAQAKVFDINSLLQLDYILITHEHFDHMDIPFIKQIVQKFPDVKIVTNISIKEILEKENLKATTLENEFIKIQQVPHEKIVGMEPPLNIQFDLFGIFSDPGDSHSFTKSLEILALPIQAPWGSYTRAIEKVLETKPKVVIPIHDWHWKDEVRIQMYKRTEDFLKQHGIDFKSLETGETVEV